MSLTPETCEICGTSLSFGELCYWNGVKICRRDSCREAAVKSREALIVAAAADVLRSDPNWHRTAYELRSEIIERGLLTKEDVLGADFIDDLLSRTDGFTHSEHSVVDVNTRFYWKLRGELLSAETVY